MVRRVLNIVLHVEYLISILTIYLNISIELELAPYSLWRTGCQGFIGPFPLPFLIIFLFKNWRKDISMQMDLPNLFFLVNNSILFLDCSAS